MTRYALDPPDDDAYDVKYDGTACSDCGAPSVAWLCETCSDRRDTWVVSVQLRMQKAALHAVAAALGRKDVA